MEILELIRTIEPILTPTIAAAVGGGVAWVGKNTKGIRNRQTYMWMKQEAMDYALEQEFDNGYANKRNQKFEELRVKHNFINHTDNFTTAKRGA